MGRKTRRSLYRSPARATPSMRGLDTLMSPGPRGDVREEIDLAEKIDAMSANMTARLDKMEQNIHTTIASAIQSAMDDFKIHVMAIIDDVRSNLQTQVTSLRADMEAREKNSGATLARNLVVRNVPEREGENVKVTIDNIVKKGLKLTNINVVAAERKNGRFGKPGVIVAQCQTKDQKIAVMEKKATLRDHTQYKDVVIHNDKPYYERQTESNMRLLVSTLARGALTMKGARITKSDENTSNSQGRRPHLTHQPRQQQQQQRH